MRTIPEQKRQNLPRILKQLGMTQKDLADALEISAGAVSKYLAIGSGHARLRPERLERLVQILKNKLGSLPQEDELLGASQLSNEARRALQTEIDELLVDAEEDPVRESVLAMPGGTLPIRASNYIRRPADAEIEDMLINLRAPGIVIVAPVNGGTSSFLNRVYHYARGIPGAWASIAHLDTAFAVGEEFDKLRLFQTMFREVGALEGALSRDVEQLKGDFEDWAEANWKSPSRVFLIVDGLDQVFKTSQSPADPLSLINWLGTLRNKAASDKAPYNKLTVIVALAGRTWSAGFASPFATQAFRLQLGKFDRDQVREVFEDLGINELQYDIGRVYELFHGHPYLTHVFAWSIRGGSSREKAEQQAFDLEGSYETHWENLKAEVRYFQPKFPVREALAVAIAALDTPDLRSLSDHESEVWSIYYSAFRTFGLVDGTRDSPKMCNFYRRAITQEIELSPMSGTRINPPPVKTDVYR